MKKIIFINERLPAPFIEGGSQSSNHTFLTLLSERGYEMWAIGVVEKFLTGSLHDYPGTFEEILEELKKRNIDYKYDDKAGMVEYECPYRVRIYKKISIESLWSDIGDNNSVVLTQTELSAEVVDVSIRNKVPTVIFIRDNLMERNRATLLKIKPEMDFIRVVFNSSLTRKINLELVKGDGHDIIHPPIKLANYRIDEVVPKYITMINPVEYKGGRIFLEIARHFKDLDFLAVKCWYDPIKDGIDLKSLSNITVWDRKDDVREIYRVSRLVLIPSQWEEAFGRVAVEAAYAGIPVVASDQAGLREALGDWGIFVKNYSSTESWIEKIKEVLGAYDNLVSKERIEKARSYVNRFDAGKLTDKLEQILNSLPGIRDD